MMSQHRRPPMRAHAIPHNRQESHSSLRSVAIRVDAHYSATPERVFHAWLDAQVARRWLFATASRPSANVAIDARVPGSFRFVERREAGDVEHRGEYVEIVPCRRLVFSLALPHRRRVLTRVSIDIEAEANGSMLALTHEQVPPDLAYDIEARWSGMLYGLGETLDAINGDPAFERSPLARHGPLRRSALAEDSRP
jgi:uncharacterized protein YndB with AHSA1/START domain